MKNNLINMNNSPQSDKKPSRKYLWNRKYCLNLTLVFVFTMFLYAMIHASRTAWAYSQAYVISDPYFSDKNLGIIDMTFLLCYAFGMIYNGWVGDHTNLKKFLTVGCLLGVSGYMIFTVLAVTKQHYMALDLVLWGLNGFGQSRLYPGLVSVLGNWIGSSNRGILLGIWSGNLNIGNIIGQ